MIKKELKIETASGTPNEKIVGNLTIRQLVGIAQMKKSGSLARNLKNVAKETVDTCSSMGVTIEGMRAKDAIAEINSGKFDSAFSEQFLIRSICSSVRFKEGYGWSVGQHDLLEGLQYGTKFRQ